MLPPLHYLKYLLILSLTLHSSFTILAQVPGGIGNGLQLWHKGEDIANPNAPGLANVNQDWPDANPNSPLLPSVYTNPTGSVYTVEDNLNFNRTLNLNDEWWESSLDINATPFLNGVNVFTVFRPTDTASIYLWGNGAAGQPNRGRQAYTEQLTDGSGAPSTYNVGGTGFNPYINFIELREGSPTNSQTSNIYWNGGYLAGIPTFGTIESPGDVTPHLFIGKASEDDNPTSANGLDLELAEFIVYSGSLSQATREKITSYLGIKYGITLGHNYVLSNDSIAWNRIGHSYNNNIIGIARDIEPLPNGSNGNLQQNRSRSEESGDNLEINALADYQSTTGRRSLMIGHNGAQTNDNNVIIIDNNFFRRGRRVRRVWRCQEIGDYPTYTISFNNTISLPNGFDPNNMVLLVSTDETFSSNVTAYPLRPNGSYTKATGVDMPSDVSYMTIAQMETVTWIHTTAPNNNIGGGLVNTMADQVLGINDMQGANLTGNNPTFTSTPTDPFMNFHPYITFNDGVGDNWIERDALVGYGKVESSTFIVTANDGTGGPNQTFFSYATESSPGNTQNDGNTLVISTPNNIKIRVNDGALGFSSNVDITTNNEVSLISHVRGNNAADRIAFNGVTQSTNYSNNEFIFSNGTLIIGQEQDAMGDPVGFDNNERLEGDFAELITFNEQLSVLQTQQVHSYLAVKYGLLLAHDYIAADGDTIWDRTVNTDYNRTIGGIGRDDAFELDQRKSRSQKADAIVTIEHPNPFPADDSYLLWGSVLYSSGITLADYDVIGTTGAPQGLEISERYWKVSNPNNRVGPVVVRMDIPPSRAGNLAGAKLLISTTANFVTGFTSAVPGSVVGTEIVFSGVSLLDGQYFTLGFDEDLFYTNNEVNAPTSFEACAGDSVTFSYRALATHPQDVRLRSNDPNNPFTYGLNITISNQQPDTVGVRGKIALRIPANAATGNVSFLDAPVTGNVIYTSSMPIIINNPMVAFVPANNPICADQTTALFGFPSGGTFSSNIAGLITPSGDSLYGLGAGWSALHDDSLVVDVTYQYYPKYTNGLDCAFPRETMDSLVIRDNRLSNLTLNSVIKQPNVPLGANDVPLGVNRNTIITVTPDIFGSGAGFPHPFSFTGTYVTGNNVFLTDIAEQASTRHPVTFGFNNQGCIASEMDTIDILRPLVIESLPDTICSGAAAFLFYRDTINNPYFISVNGTDTTEHNRIINIRTVDPNQSLVITTLNATQGSEVFQFIPTAIPSGDILVQVIITYQTTTTGPGGTSTQIADAIASVVVTPRPTLDISTLLDTVYYSGAIDTLRPIPAFDNRSTTYFTLVGADTLGNFTLVDTLPLDTIFNTSNHYNALVNPPNRDLTMRLTYTVNRYGCIDSATTTTIIRKAFNTSFFTNHAPNAPLTFEACYNDSITISYRGLTTVPQQVRFKSTNPANVFTYPANISASTTLPDTNGTIRGELYLVIPNDAATGTIELLDAPTNGAVLYSSNAFITIHNPTIAFVPANSPLCADQTTELFGFPDGGTFSSNIAGLITPSGDSLYGLGAGWSANHDDSLDVPITYTYYPRYTNNSICPNPATITDTLTIRDNRLDAIIFAPLTQQNAVVSNQVLSLDTSLSNMVVLTTPDIFCHTIGACLPHNFSGAFVDAQNNFLSPLASGRNLVTLEYNNKGCIGSASNFIDIQGLLVINNLPDTICRSSSVVFGRDSSLVFSDTSFVVNSNTRRIINNQLLNTYASNPAHQNAIISNNNTAGQEDFIFLPSLLPNTVSSVVINMQYQNLTTLTDPLGVVTTIVADTFIVADTIGIIRGVTSLSIGNLQTAYCANYFGDTLFPSLGFLGPNNNNLYLLSNGPNGLDTSTLVNNFLSPSALYNALVPSGIGDLTLTLAYEASYYGCPNEIPVANRPTITITAPQHPSFTSQSPYCQGDPPDRLQRPMLASNVSEIFTGSPAVDPITGLFIPQFAGIGNNLITYAIIDTNGCTYSFTDTVVVNQGPVVELSLNGSPTLTNFCYSEQNVAVLNTITFAPNTVISTSFFGNALTVTGANSAIFDPSQIYANGDTTATIWVELQDAVGCLSSDTAYISVIPPPIIDIDSAFNFMAGVAATGATTHSYCANTASFLIEGKPSHTTGANYPINTIIGDGIDRVGNNFRYNPSLVPTNVDVDTVVFFYTDLQGCSNTDTAIIKIDTTPTVVLSGLPSPILCNNNDTIQLIGSPNTGQGFFRGFGVDSVTGIFLPARANLGVQNLVYEYRSNSGCFNSDTVQVDITTRPFPEPRGYNTAYCINATNDTLFSANDTTGVYQFFGDLILSGTDILTTSGLPDTTAVLYRDLYYQYTNITGCTVYDTISIRINPTTEIYFNDLDSSYCSNGNPQNFRVSPNGGYLINSDTAFSVLTADNRYITLSPMQTDTGYTTVTYAFTDGNGCSDTLTARTYIKAVTLPSIVGLDSFYCKTNDTIPLTVSITGGFFNGSGVDSNANGDWFFIPANAQNGLNNIQYILPGSVAIAGQPLICRADTTEIVHIQPQLSPNLLSPTRNAEFCSNDSIAPLIYDPLSPSVVHSFRTDTSTAANVILNNNNAYFFVPSNTTQSSNIIIYTVVDTVTGCTDSIDRVLSVNRYSIPRINGLDSSYCERDTAVQIYGEPTGSIVTRDGAMMTPVLPLSSGLLLFETNGLGLPNNPLTTTIQDTIKSIYVNGACSDSVFQIVDIYPVFNINFTLDTSVTNKVFCLGGDTVNLIPSTSGGVFSGNGVRTGTDFFIPDLAEAGIHPISFEYTDSVTGCYSNFMDTFYVYGVPNAVFNIQGGCQFDTIAFVPNNAVLGLNNLFQNNYIDSVTRVIWHISNSVQIVGSGQRDSIAPIYYQYTTPGTYNTQLIIANREVCIDTQIMRLVISPKINNYPYAMDFENDNGGWFAESRDSSHRLLWEWGSDITPQGIAADANNNIWATQTNASYQPNENAWVYSPCFDLSTLDRPMISLDYWSDVRSSDGAVLEYQAIDGAWLPLGTVNRGINWYNSTSVYARPGDQVLPGSSTSLGWVGQQQLDWKNGRYKLDGIAHNNATRFRIAFASLPNPIGTFLDGFAFDNVVIRNRTRNVLVETMVHSDYTNMENINNANYQLVHHTELNKDVVLLQYHIESTNGQGSVGNIGDYFYLDNPSLGRTRSYEYRSPAGRAFIDGIDSAYITKDLSTVDFEQDMLETPKFSVSIDTFRHLNSNFQIVANVTALQAIPTGDYRIYTVISQDSLNYPSGGNYDSQVHAVARENDEYHLNINRGTDNLYSNRAWATGETQRVEFNWDHSFSGFINYQLNHFHAVVFIQNISTKEIFQVATTRDVSGYWVGINPIQAEKELNELQSLRLFPNPAHDYFNLQFDQALEHDYQWKLVNMQGVEVQQGNIQMGTDQIRIEDLDYPSGAYILLLYNKNVFVQRKVILGRP